MHIEYYVPTETQFNFIRSPRDIERFAASYRRRVVRAVDAMTSPTIKELRRDDQGRPFTVVRHAHSHQILNVTYQ